MNKNNTKVKKRTHIQILNKGHCSFLVSDGVTTGVC